MGNHTSSPADDELTTLEALPTTESGAVQKEDALIWLESLDDPDDNALQETVVPQPYDHSGSTYAEPISQIRVTGTPEFITEVAKRFTVFLEFENAYNRLDIKLQRTKDREAGELTDNYALYLSVAKRGGKQ